MSGSQDSSAALQASVLARRSSGIEELPKHLWVNRPQVWAKILLCLALYVFGSSVLGLLLALLVSLAGEVTPNGPVAMFLGFWSSSLAADVLFLGGSIGSGIAGVLVAKKSKLVSIALAAALTSLTYMLAIALINDVPFRVAGAGGGRPDAPSILLSPLFGLPGLVFAASAPAIARGYLIGIMAGETQSMPFESSVENRNELLLRPSGKALPANMIRWGGLLALAVGGLFVFAWIGRLSIAISEWTSGVFAALVIFISLATWINVRNDRVFAGDDRFGIIDWRGHRRAWPLSILGRVVYGPVEIGGQERAQVISVTLILDSDESALISLTDYVWAATDLQPLWDRLGKEPVAGWSEPLRPRALRRRFHGAVPGLP